VLLAATLAYLTTFRIVMAEGIWMVFFRVVTSLGLVSVDLSFIEKQTVAAARETAGWRNTAVMQDGEGVRT
jgi:hypothetical protein